MTANRFLSNLCVSIKRAKKGKTLSLGLTSFTPKYLYNLLMLR
jgi:hypothetical protein